MTHNKHIKNMLRIISGKWRGRKIPICHNDSLRPSPNLVREILFNWLMFRTADASVLDCYSGTGALALEALSRGAKKAWLVEKNKEIANNLKNITEILSCDLVKIFNQDFFTFALKNHKESFDIVFLDPPFRKDMLKKSLELIIANNYVHESSLIYIEYEREISINNIIPDGWKIIKDKTLGQVACCLISFDPT